MEQNNQDRELTPYEKKLQRNREYKRINKIHISAVNKLWIKNNKDKKSIHNKTFYDNHQDEILSNKRNKYHAEKYRS